MPDGDRLRLVSDEFDEESLSGDDYQPRVHHHHQDSESLQIKQVPCCAGAMGGCGQVTIFTMVWMVLIGICMLFVHIVAREDPIVNNSPSSL